MASIVAPVVNQEQPIDLVARRRIAHSVQLGAGIAKAADMLLPLLSDHARTHENAVILARTAALYVLAYRSASMTIDDAVSALMEAKS